MIDECVDALRVLACSLEVMTMKRNTIKPAALADSMRLKVTARRVSNWLTGARSPNVCELHEMLKAMPDADARGLVADMAARYQAKH